MSSLVGPKKGEKWTVGTYNGLTYFGVGRDFTQEKYLLFETPEGNYFVIKKDDFYSEDCLRQKE